MQVNSFTKNQRTGFFCSDLNLDYHDDYVYCFMVYIESPPPIGGGGGDSQ